MGSADYHLLRSLSLENVAAYTVPLDSSFYVNSKFTECFHFPVLGYFPFCLIIVAVLFFCFVGYDTIICAVCLWKMLQRSLFHSIQAFCEWQKFIECFHFPVLGHFPLCSVKLNMPIMFCLLAVTPPKLRLILESTLFLWTFSLLGQISGGAPNNQ